jgi:hypothetical protein
MTKELRHQRKAGLALAIAQGRSVAFRAHDNEVPRSTADRWACQPDVRARAESYRRRAQDRALGGMANRAYWKCYRVATLVRDAESESVSQLQAKHAFSNTGKTYVPGAHAPGYTMSPPPEAQNTRTRQQNRDDRMAWSRS